MAAAKFRVAPFARAPQGRSALDSAYECAGCGIRRADRPCPIRKPTRNLAAGGVNAPIGKEATAVQTMKDAASEFLAHKRIAVTGVSRTPDGHGGNVVYRRLRDRGYEVFAVNPNADEVEGDHCYADLVSIPGGVEAVVIATRPATAESTMRECVELGIRHVWMHRLSGEGSVSAAATTYGRAHGVTVLDGGCPLMFAPTNDFGHRLLRFVGTRTGAVPKRV